MIAKSKIKNIAIIAHVDHGKTTLVDGLLRQSGLFRDNQKVEERMMDSNAIERERGITIFSKNASVTYEGYKINIVDTPGHQDFGGEVQRILKMVDSVLILVDAFEGVMPQTKYVLKNSLKIGHRPIVVINKIDRPNCSPDETLNAIFDLFIDLGASEEQLDFPVVYASAKKGVAHNELGDDSTTLKPLFDAILKNAPVPDGDLEKAFQMQVSSIEYDTYVGRLGTGRISNGKITKNEQIIMINRDGEQTKHKVTALYTYEGMSRKEITEAGAGDIVTVAGIENIDVGNTLACAENPEALPSIDIDEPTVSITFQINDSPLAGKEGKWVTSRNIKDRLFKEQLKNISIQVEETADPDKFVVKGRGELQLSIMIEEMRREGYEFSVSRPKVIFKEIDGVKMEPIESVIIDVEEEFSGVVIEKLGQRKGELLGMQQNSDGYTRVEFKVPARGLIGYHTEFLTDTRGNGVLNHSFLDYEPYKGDIPSRKRGALISLERGKSMGYSIFNLQDRGDFFIEAGVDVYSGMIVGENNKNEDLDVNICKNKKFSNVRASGSDENIKLSPPKKLTLEQAMEFLDDDELLEVTPLNYRLRKKILDKNMRARKAKNK